MQRVELHYHRTPTFDYDQITLRAAEILESDIDSSPTDQAEKAFLIFHKDHFVEYTDGRVPAQTAVLGAGKPPDIALYQKVIQQSRSCPTALDLLRDSKKTRLVTEMMTSGLPPQARVSLFHGVLRAAIDVTKPDALAFMHTDQVVTPAAYRAACSEEPILRPGSLNVRFFNIANSDGHMIMDTRGLDEIGLHDLQCHYCCLDPTAVARVLFNTAVYIFENGAVIEPGQTIEGVEPGSKWLCQFEESLLEPRRNVLDVNPGEPFAAGNC